MKLAFFIGHHKTGSTSIQTYLATHYLRLLKAGILYPAVESSGMASNLATVLQANAHAPVVNLNVREPHNALAFGLISEALKREVPPWHKNLPSGFQMFEMIDAQIHALAPKHTIICSEVMSRFAEQGWPKIMPRIRARFAHHDCSIVLNLRRIDDYLASWHLQVLKFGAVVDPLRHGAQAKFYQTAHFQYDSILTRWSQALPQARMVVRNYADVMAAGGSVVDFFAQSQIDYAPTEPNPHLNTSLPYALAEILRQANIALPAHRSEMLNYLLGAAHRVDLIPNAEVELFGATHRAALLNAFAPVHKRLSDFLGLEAFFHDLDQVSLCRPIPEMTAAAAALQALRQDAAENAPSAEVRDFVKALVLEP